MKTNQSNEFSDIGLFLIVSILVIFASFLAGYFTYKETHPKPPEPTWGQLVAVMPPSIKRDIAIDFCVANKRACRTMPLSSPINPMDSKGK